MFGKHTLRKKALEAMMKEGPSIPIKKRPKPGMEMMEADADPAEQGEEEGGPEEQGSISIMVTPEEKEMILSMRKQGKSKQGMGMGMDMSSLESDEA